VNGATARATTEADSSAALRNDSQKGKGKGKGNSNSNSNNKYRDPSLRSG
jgi:hypothetical protein